MDHRWRIEGTRPLFSVFHLTGSRCTWLLSLSGDFVYTHMKGCDGCLTYPQLHSRCCGWAVSGEPGADAGAASGVSHWPNLSRQAGSPLIYQTYGCLSSLKPERIMGNRAIAFDALQPPNPPSLLSADTPFSNLWKAVIPCWPDGEELAGTGAQSFGFHGGHQF